MAKKKVAGQLKLQVPAGKANPSPPIGPALGQRGINIMEFCKAFNAMTQSFDAGAPIPAIITYYQDKSFKIDIGTPVTSYLILQKAKLKGGSQTPGRETVGALALKDVRDIAEIKMPDLNANTIEQAMQIIMGSARSMGIEVKGA